MGYVSAAEDWSRKPYYEPGHRLYFVLKGGATMYLEKQQIPLKEGQMYLMPRKFPYGLTGENGMETLIWHLTLTMEPGVELLDLLESHVELPFDEITKTMLNQCLQKPIDESKREQIPLYGEFMSLAWHSINRILEPHQEIIVELQGKHNKFKPMYNYIVEHLGFQLKISELAAVMNVSESYLSRSFKQLTGKTVREYIREQLLMRIKVRLLYSENSLQDIAEEFQFTDVYYFSHFFKRLEGLSPSTYRKCNKLSTHS
jgi:AraC-like DNA-binding protein